MKRLTLFTTACLLALLAVMAVQIRAQQTDTNDRTFMTFNSAVELPGVTLEPGEYEFRLADTPSRNVVQVFRRNDSKPMGQWTYVPTERERTSEETVVMFREAREGATPAVQYWYYPGEKIGKEFIYPKDQAERIAARTGQSVRTDDGVIAGQASASAATTDGGANAAPSASASVDRNPPADVNAPASATAPNAASATTSSADSDASLRNAPVPAQPTAPAGSTAGNRGTTTESSASASASSSDNAQTADSTLRTAPVPAQPTAAAGSTAGNRGVTAQQPETTRAEAQPAPAPAADPAPRAVGTSGAADQAQPEGQVARAELPQTASPLPLSALIGLLSLAGAAGLRFFRS